MSEEEIMSLLRAIKEQLNTMERRQVMMDERQKLIKQEVDEQEQGSFGRHGFTWCGITDKRRVRDFEFW